MSRNRLEKYLPANKRVRMLVLMIVDIVVLGLASFLGLFIRFDMNIGKIPQEYIEAVIAYLPFYILVTIAVFFLFSNVRYHVERGRNPGSRAHSGSLRIGFPDSDSRDDYAGITGAEKLLCALLFCAVCS